MNSFIQDCYDAGRTAVAEGTLLQLPPRLLWKYQSASLSDWEPAPATKYSKKKCQIDPVLRNPQPPFIDGDRVVFTDGGAYQWNREGESTGPATIHCVHASTGEKIWTRLHDIPGLIRLEGLAAGLLIVHRWWETDASLRAFSVADGSEVWTLPGFNLASNLLVVGMDIVAVLKTAASESQGSSALMRIDGKNGVIKWGVPLVAESFEVASDRESIYIAEGCSESITFSIACYSLADGTLRWSVALDGRSEPLKLAAYRSPGHNVQLPNVARLGVRERRLYVSFVRTAVACLDASTGLLLWVFADLEIGSLVTTLLMNDAICTTSELSQGEHTYCRVNRHTGEPLLKRMLPYAAGSAMPFASAAGEVIVVPRGELCLVSRDGRLSLAFCSRAGFGFRLLCIS